jgi:hypothetical protein
MNGTSKRARLLAESRWLVQTGAARMTEWIREWTVERRWFDGDAKASIFYMTCLY